ncbi:unnamed protein product [Zymoseptoria tritici ST99CH_1E4]|uniref:Shelterin complex subunit TPP1/Est3 domain-containing protein n=1 Tax=Zymoseptoria tritici ST99CH_1E4 TaxID=1276532 RepID=A0A2H1GAG8_ZYMTR|nr:unnamed protein product [Zymoseptoria tritici ST99CH_1E4]
MARRPLNPWIADFVKNEIEAVLAWADRKKVKSFVKLENDGRFSDDGSNFRNAVSSLEPEKDQLQLIKVLAAGNTVNAVLSDGQTCIKARLSDNAVEIFESALDDGEQLDLEVTGDVIRLKSFTIVTTAFGSEEDYIQLTVEDIDYCHHLRKLVGDPVSVEKDPRIRPLIDRVIKSLVPADPIEEWDADQESIHSQVESPGIGSQASINVPRSSPPMEPETQLQGIETSVRSSQHIQDSAASRRSALRLQKRSAAEAGLENDGFEMQSGVNLDRPVIALRKPDTKIGAKLLGLLGSKCAEPETVAETPARFVPHSNQERYAQLHVVPETFVETPRGKGDFDRTEQVDPPSSPPVHVINGSIDTGVNSLGQAQSGTSSEVCHTTRPKIAYGRRKIPANQKKLLDLASSWLPSLPGQTFPKPNVPIEILKKWNATPAVPRVATPRKMVATRSRSGSATPTEEASHGPSLPQSAEQAFEEDEDDDEDEAQDEDDDDDIPASQWPSSAPENPSAPPVSSLGDVIHDDLSVSPSKTPNLPPDSSLGSLVVSPPKAAPVNRAHPKAPADLRNRLPVRPNVPLPSGPSFPPSRGGEDQTVRPHASLSQRSIPTGPRNPSHYRGDFSPSGHPYHEPRRSESLHSQHSQRGIGAAPREAHAYRPTFGSSRPVSAASSHEASLALAEASPMAIRISPQHSVGKSPKSVGQSPRKTKMSSQVTREQPHSQASPSAIQASSQRSVDRSIQSAAKVGRVPTAEAHSEADKRPPFEKSLGHVGLAASARSASQSSPTASRGSLQQSPSKVIAAPPQMRPTHEQPSQPQSRSSSSVASPLRTSLQPSTSQLGHRYAPDRHPADLSNRPAAERQIRLAPGSEQQRSNVKSANGQSFERASNTQHSSQSSDGPSQIPATRPTPQSNKRARLAVPQTTMTKTPDQQANTQQALNQAGRRTTSGRLAPKADAQSPTTSQQGAKRSAQPARQSSSPVEARHPGPLESSSRPFAARRDGSASHSDQRSPSAPANCMPRKQPNPTPTTLPSIGAVDPQVLHRRQRQAHREIHALPAKPAISAADRSNRLHPPKSTYTAAVQVSRESVARPRINSDLQRQQMERIEQRKRSEGALERQRQSQISGRVWPAGDRASRRY